MIDTVIVSGGDIQSDFALDFLKKNAEKAGKEKIRLIAADRGLEFFLEQQILPEVVIGWNIWKTEDSFLCLQEQRRTVL